METDLDRYVGDRLAQVGVAVGAFLVLYALGTLLGAPWATQPDVGALVVRLLGVLGVAALGIGLVWLTLSEKPSF